MNISRAGGCDLCASSSAKSSSRACWYEKYMPPKCRDTTALKLSGDGSLHIDKMAVRSAWLNSEYSGSVIDNSAEIIEPFSIISHNLFAFPLPASSKLSCSYISRVEVAFVRMRL